MHTKFDYLFVVIIDIISASYSIINYYAVASA